MRHKNALNTQVDIIVVVFTPYDETAIELTRPGKGRQENAVHPVRPNRWDRR
ncbi:MAG: hypothetical protein ACJATP_000129 [Candidatus Azotimanducaceae bacterium]|jgi:hypothetical protein